MLANRIMHYISVVIKEIIMSHFEKTGISVIQ